MISPGSKAVVLFGVAILGLVTAGILPVGAMTKQFELLKVFGGKS